jgi:uncharacterized Tic20 family protein
MAQNSFLGTDSQPSYTPTPDEKNLALISHIITLISSFLAPLIIYLIKKDESAFIAETCERIAEFSNHGIYNLQLS